MAFDFVVAEPIATSFWALAEFASNNENAVTKRITRIDLLKILIGLSFD
jgi:hypothetical protein